MSRPSPRISWLGDALLSVDHLAPCELRLGTIRQIALTSARASSLAPRASAILVRSSRQALATTRHSFTVESRSSSRSTISQPARADTPGFLGSDPRGELQTGKIEIGHRPPIRPNRHCRVRFASALANSDGLAKWPAPGKIAARCQQPSRRAVCGQGLKAIVGVGFWRADQRLEEGELAFALGQRIVEPPDIFERFGQPGQGPPDEPADSRRCRAMPPLAIPRRPAIRGTSSRLRGYRRRSIRIAPRLVVAYLRSSRYFSLAGSSATICSASRDIRGSRVRPGRSLAALPGDLADPEDVLGMVEQPLADRRATGAAIPRCSRKPHCIA